MEWIDAATLVGAATLPGVVAMFVQFTKEDIDEFLARLPERFRFRLKTKNYVYLCSYVFPNLGLLILQKWTWQWAVLAIIGAVPVAYGAIKLHESMAKDGADRQRVESALEPSGGI